MFKKLLARWKRKKQVPVIQIGIGGYSSSGKTMLIDAMFGLFAHMFRPNYMRNRPKKEGFFTDQDFRASYRSYAQLRDHVNQNLTGKATADKGVWNENTHFGRLRFCSKEAIILIRNIPGELFSNFYDSKTFLNNQSIHELFTVFADRADKTWKSWFKEKKGKELENMRTTFFESLNGQFPGHAEEINVHQTNFFAYLFYTSSDFNIYCIKSDVKYDVANTKEFTDNTTNLQILSDLDVKEDNFPLYICFTQMDKALNANTVPTFATTKAAEIIPIDTKVKKPGFFQGIWRTLVGQGPKKQHEEQPKKEKPTELMQYWQTMELLHRDFKKGRSTGLWNYFNTEQMLTLKNLVNDNHKFPVFISSVAYNSDNHCFFSFGTSENGTTPAGVWNIGNVSPRTPLGVLELVLNILKRSGYDLDRSRLDLTPLRRDEKFQTIIEKIDE